jgi:hypothetical protein
LYSTSSCSYHFWQSLPDPLGFFLSYLSHYDIMTNSHIDTWHHNKISKASRANKIDSWFQLQVRLTFEDFWFVTFFHKTHLLHMTSEDSLRGSPLLHPFSCRRSGTLDWCVTRATSADSRRLIHTILAHSSTAASSTLLHCIIIQPFVTIGHSS